MLKTLIIVKGARLSQDQFLQTTSWLRSNGFSFDRDGKFWFKEMDEEFIPACLKLLAEKEKLQAYVKEDQP